MADVPSPWLVYRGSINSPSVEQIARWLQTPPPWRASECASIEREAPGLDPEGARRGESYVLADHATLKRVNAALLLRKPLLVEGLPGLGKSQLAWSLAYRLGLGTPLVWPLNSKSTLAEALYRYEAVAHLQASDVLGKNHENGAEDIGQFITLGPLGTAMLPWPKPRVLLIDEIDKASFDLPNDLLHVLEERRFVVPELLRYAKPKVSVVTWDSRSGERITVEIQDGQIRSGQFPVVVFTSNGEREFPEAFLRRCVRLTLTRPAPEVLAQIATHQLGHEVTVQAVERILSSFSDPEIATDHILSALFLEQAHHVEADDLGQVLLHEGTS